MAMPWELYAVHRARVTSLLLRAAPLGAGSLVLLGAGRCRDVDLAALADRYVAIHLVDRERAYLEEAIARQRPSVRPRLHLHDGVELSGLEPHLPQWKTNPPDAGALGAVMSRVPGEIADRLPAGDVVASTCLLSQLCYQVSQWLPPEHPAASPVRTALVQLHLRTLASLTRPGGWALLINDLTVAPRGELEAQVISRGAQAIVDDLVTRRHHFRGAAPADIEAWLHDQPEVVRVEPVEPWLWTRTDDLTYLVYAVRFQRSRSLACLA